MGEYKLEFTLVEEVKHYLEVNKITQRELAMRANIDPATLSRMLRTEQTGISFPVLEGLCKAMGITPHDVIKWTKTA